MNTELEIGELCVADLPISTIELTDSIESLEEQDLFALVARTLAPKSSGATREVWEVARGTPFIVLARTFANYVILCEERRLIVSYQLINHLSIIGALRRFYDNEPRPHGTVDPLDREKASEPL